ncbi:MAG: Gldg family protein [Pseudomonadota bacterium]
MLKGFINTTNIIILCVALVSINFIASKIKFKADLTGVGLYTLSEGSKKIVKAIDDEVTIKYFFSRSHGNLPVQIKNYGQRVEELLHEFASHSSNLSVEVYDPKPDSDEEELAVKCGINSAQAGENDPFYMGAAVIYHDKTYRIPLFDPRREAFLEYDVASLLAKLKESGGKKTAGILSGFPLSKPFTPQVDQEDNAGGENWLFVEELKNQYEIKEIENTTEEIPSDISLLLVLHPRNISEKTEYALEQYILKGGKAVICVDPSAQSIPDKNSPYAQYGMSPQTSSDLKNVFKMLDIEYDSEKVVADNEHGTRVTMSGRGAVQYPYWLSLDNTCVNKNTVLASQLNTLLFVEPGFFTLKSDSKNSYESILNSGSASGTILSKKLGFSGAQNFDDYDKQNKSLSLAGIVKGRFSSAFKKKPEGSKYSLDHKDASDAENSVIIIGDVDFLCNRYALRQLNFFGQKMLQPLNQNVAFLSNALEFIAGNSELISIRSRGSFIRPFVRVEGLEKAAQAKWLTVEKELTDKIQELQKKLNELQKASADGNSLTLSTQQQAEINKFKEEQMKAKKKRREVRNNLRQDIERMGTMLTALNITIVPILVLLTGLYIYIKRNRGKSILTRS